MHDEIVVATTGEVGLGQRLVQTLKHALQDPAQRAAFLLNTPPAEVGTKIAELTVQNFRRTMAPWSRAYDLGALIGAVVNNEPRLYYFDHVNFRPELVGERDEAGLFRTPPVVTHGGGQRLADPFVLHAQRVLFGENHFPDVAEGRLLVAWTLAHVIRYNVGGVGGASCIVTLEQSSGAWRAAEVDEDEMQEAVKDIEQHMREYRRTEPEVAVPDIHAELEALAAPATQDPGA